jgi:hypothetical protein
MLSAAICCYLLLSAAICCYLVPSAAICCYLLPSYVLVSENVSELFQNCLKIDPKSGPKLVQIGFRRQA